MYYIRSSLFVQEDLMALGDEFVNPEIFYSNCVIELYNIKI